MISFSPGIMLTAVLSSLVTNLASNLTANGAKSVELMVKEYSTYFDDELPVFESMK